MGKKKICFIAQFPPPIHGLSKAVETLYNSGLSDTFEFEKINITDNKRFLGNVIKIAGSKADLFYFTISQTKGGNLRDLMILWLLALRRRKCLVHLHGGYYRTLVDKELPQWQKKANYSAMAKVSGAIVLGDSMKAIFRGMVDDDKIYAVENCVDDAYLMEHELFNQKLAAMEETDVKHVLYLSNMIRTKGYLKVLQMAKSEKERCASGEEKKFHFDFAGLFFEKTEEEAFLGYIKENGLQKYVTYHGSVTGEKKRKLLSESAFFVLLTSYPREGQPISILEAMGNGMMIVTTNYAGIPDIVKDGENGMVVAVETSVERIYQDMLQTNDEKLREIWKRNRDCIEKRFLERHYISNMKNVFETVE